MKGKVCLLLSAFIYGLAPMLSKIAYRGGANVMTLTFLRTFMMLPPLFVWMKMNRYSLKITASELIKIAALGIVGGTLTNVSLYLSYDYISTGLATTLHFIYPLMIIVVSALVYRERISKTQLLAAVLVTGGIFMFVNLNTRSDTLGVFLALMSGIFYSFYVVYMDYSGINRMDFVKLTFYLLIFMSAGTLIFGVWTKTLDFAAMDGEGWALSFIISLVTTVLALPLFQLGIRCEGAPSAGIISAFEPITTLALGALFLGERMNIAQLLGGIIILTGVIIAQRSGNN